MKLIGIKIVGGLGRSESEKWMRMMKSFVKFFPKWMLVKE